MEQRKRTLTGFIGIAVTVIIGLIAIAIIANNYDALGKYQGLLLIGLVIILMGIALAVTANLVRRVDNKEEADVIKEEIKEEE